MSKAYLVKQSLVESVSYQILVYRGNMHPILPRNYTILAVCNIHTFKDAVTLMNCTIGANNFIAINSIVSKEFKAYIKNELDCITYEI